MGLEVWEGRRSRGQETERGRRVHEIEALFIYFCYSYHFYFLGQNNSGIVSQQKLQLRLWSLHDIKYPFWYYLVLDFFMQQASSVLTCINYLSVKLVSVLAQEISTLLSSINVQGTGSRQGLHVLLSYDRAIGYCSLFTRSYCSCQPDVKDSKWSGQTWVLLWSGNGKQNWSVAKVHFDRDHPSKCVFKTRCHKFIRCI